MRTFLRLTISLTFQCIEDLLKKSGKKAADEHAAVWVPDAEAQTCMHCKKVQFTLVNRRHHCRFSTLAFHRSLLLLATAATQISKFENEECIEQVVEKTVDGSKENLSMAQHQETYFYPGEKNLSINLCFIYK